MATISIIMPVYNKENTVARAIQSVLNQTYKNFQLIIINDGSIDNSENIILSYKEKDSRIIYIKQQNQGVASARNKGLENSNSEYISFLDSDDHLDNSFFDKMFSTIEENNACYCGHYDVFYDKKVKPKLKFISGDILVDYIFNKCTPNTNSWLIRRDYLTKYKIRFPIGIDWGEDMIFFAKVLFHDTNIMCKNENLSYYHKGQQDSLSTNSIDKIEKDIFWMNMLIDYIKSNKIVGTRSTKVIEAIESYRLPAAIIYRLDGLHFSGQIK